jgi:hypothetical protein
MVLQFLRWGQGEFACVLWLIEEAEEKKGVRFTEKEGDTPLPEGSTEKVVGKTGRDRRSSILGRKMSFSSPISSPSFGGHTRRSSSSITSSQQQPSNTNTPSIDPGISSPVLASSSLLASHLHAHLLSLPRSSSLPPSPQTTLILLPRLPHKRDCLTILSIAERLLELVRSPALPSPPLPSPLPTPPSASSSRSYPSSSASSSNSPPSLSMTPTGSSSTWSQSSQRTLLAHIKAHSLPSLDYLFSNPSSSPSSDADSLSEGALVVGGGGGAGGGDGDSLIGDGCGGGKEGRAVRGTTKKWKAFVRGKYTESGRREKEEVLVEKERVRTDAGFITPASRKLPHRLCYQREPACTGG